MLDPETQSNRNTTAQMVAELNGLLADHFALYVKTKNFHWHVKGPRFRDLHLLFDEHAIEVRDQIDLIDFLNACPTTNPNLEHKE